MHPLQILIETVQWAGKNLSYNLQFIPDDKLAWKPAPEAKSALEIASEVVGFLNWMPAQFREAGHPPEMPNFETREAAQNAIEKAADGYAEFLRGLSPADLEGEIQMMELPFPKSRAVGMPVVEIVHHHGQIAYLQTLLGDTQSHFYEMNT